MCVAKRSVCVRAPPRPVALVERCILASTDEGDFVLDPFLGGGTTAIAALRNGRHCVGIEADADHIALSIARVKAEIRESERLPRAGLRPSGDSRASRE